MNENQLGFSSNQVVEEVATETDQEELALPQLYDVIDPEALESLVNSVDPAMTPLRVTFEYAGKQLIVTADGTVRVGGWRSQLNAVRS
ncbi:HalOD1 output domain-containing protein [Halosimplex pelagicum]|uniref:Halobacterial output domain-containing protein n=1 Tax=Halosimplex pelagicum TaxID=869886 RepID=A0A7D5TSI0_9EURY|nr:HalOD1 output domain-containing protein [Halosimplex pelagicum]QLH82012.1 hypothetical protein HZS54_10440 [Halosimplex pelagicum]